MALFAVRLISPTKHELWLMPEASGVRGATMDVAQRDLFISYEEAMVALSQLSQQLRDVLEHEVVKA